jgi:hypothetical protein
MKFIATLGLCLIAGMASAQKVDLDRFNFNFEYRNLPHKPLDSSYTSFSVDLEASNYITGAMGTESIKSKIDLQGFERKEMDGDVQIKLRIQDLIVDKYQVVESSSTTKNKDGSETKTYSYYVSVDYSITGSADWSDNGGAELAQGINLFSSRSYNWASATYKTRSEANNYYENNRTALINGFIRERLNEAINAANSKVNYYFGYPVSRNAENLWLSDGKKHPETEAMTLRWTALKPALEAVSANELSQETISKMTEMTKYFDDVKTRYTEDEKSHKKLRYAAWYNNAVLYLLMDMPEKAAEEARGLIANDYDAKDGEKLLEKAEALKALIALNKTNTRHFRK